MDGLNGFVTTRPDAAPPTEEQARKDIEEELDKWDEYFEVRVFAHGDLGGLNGL